MRRLVLLLLLITPIAAAEIREVPAQYATVQAAVDASMDGDVVRVAPGIYEGAIELSDRVIEIRGWEPADSNNVRSTVLTNAEDSVLLVDSTQDFASFRGLTFTGDHNGESAVHVLGFGMARFTDCHFVKNYSANLGGAIELTSGTVIVRRCRFDSNTAAGGAAIHMRSQTRAFVIDSVFVRNRVTSELGLGGAIKNFSGECYISGSLFVGNYGSFGAANHTGDGGLTLCVNSTFAQNRSPSVFGLAIGSSSSHGVIAARNCVIARNGAPRANGQALRADVAHSLIIQPGLTGPGLISAEPDFVRWPDDGGDGWGDDPNTPEDEGANDDFGDLRLLLGSPGIDAGDNRAILPDFADLDDDGDANEPTPVDFAGNPRIADDPNAPDLGIGPWAVVDMGAYESVSATSLCREDITGDGDVGLDDLAALLGAYAAQAGDPAYAAAIDITDDGAIDLRDLAAILSVFGEACPY